VGIGDASFRMPDVPFRMEKESENAPMNRSLDSRTTFS
jgi:hypothetical protein